MRVCLTLILLLAITTVKGQEDYSVEDFNGKFLQNESYGEFERNKFDIILPKSDSPTGLLIYIHGGGFTHGDKSKIYNNKKDIEFFLNNNIALATINYRFYQNNDSLGVKVCLSDVQRAIQHLRFNASKYNIDKERIGLFGVSAGAGSSLYMGFHDDLAIKDNPTLLGESTRVKCVGAIATQATYNVFRWKKFIPWLRILIPFKRKSFFNAAANFYGYPDYKSFKKNKKEIIRSLDMIDMIDLDDPPTYVINLQEETFPKNNGLIQHHKKHAMVLHKKLNKNKVKSHLYVFDKKRENQKDVDYPIREFLVDNQ